MKGFIFSASLLCIPLISFGQEATGLVTCGNTGQPDCNFCTFLQMTDNVIDFIFAIMVLAAILVIMMSGFKLVVSGGNVSAMEEAKGSITNVIVGFVIVCAAWLIVDTMMKALIDTESGFGMWNEIEDC
jgi:hypothetical protein